MTLDVLQVSPVHDYNILQISMRGGVVSQGWISQGPPLCIPRCSSPQKSHIGISVNKLRQRFAGSDLAALAKKLIKSWKKLLPSELCNL